MSYFNFEQQMIKHDIKFYKKISKCYFFSFAVSVGVIAINIPVLLHHPERWLNAACCGAMILNMVWIYTEWRMNLIEIKDLYKRDTIYKGFELKQKSDPFPSEHLLDAMNYMSGVKSSSGLQK